MEKWKVVNCIKGYENIYEISNMGNARRIGKTKNLALDTNNCGYKRLQMYNEGKHKRVFIHRLVAYYFCGGYKEGLVVNHIDGNKSNNRCDNLEFCTRSQNDVHAYRLGLRVPHPNGNSKNKYTIFDSYGHKVKTCNSLVECSEVIGITPRQASYILYRREYRNGYCIQKV